MESPLAREYSSVQISYSSTLARASRLCRPVSFYLAGEIAVWSESAVEIWKKYKFYSLFRTEEFTNMNFPTKLVSTFRLLEFKENVDNFCFWESGTEVKIYKFFLQRTKRRYLRQHTFFYFFPTNKSCRTFLIYYHF